MQNNRLIAYNILKKNILTNGFCTGCGACQATCPVNALRVKDDHVKRLQDCSQNLDLCPICNEVCPHSQALLLRSAGAVADAPIRSEAVGYLRKSLLAQASDLKARKKGSDGAVVSALLTFGLESKTFDCAVVSGADDKNPIKPKAQVALTPQEVASAAGSRYFPASVVEAYRSAVIEYAKGKIAVVGTPCQALALRKIDVWGHKIGGKAKVIIGLFCFGTFATNPFFRHIEKKYGLLANDVTGIQLSHDLVLTTKQCKVEMPLAEAKMLTNIGCKTCIDFTAEVADISIGRAYPHKDWAIVILRTKAGEDFFNSALQRGAVVTRNIEKEPEVFEHLIVAALQKRTAGLVKASKLEKKRDFVPVRLLRETKTLADIKVEDIMTREVVTVPSSMRVSELLAMMATKTYIGYPVINEDNELVGVVTIEEATRVAKEMRQKIQVGDIARPNVSVCYPGETAFDAFRKMSQLETGRVLILNPANPQKIMGIVTKRDLMHALMKQATESAL
ncbi:CBS domain-containing protein [Candidatus Bathyarchaeota archaeon]|nr:CBS domain-containing protein [Candidatus Bathyarchaeota archaeon]